MHAFIYRVERTGDREHIQIYHAFDGDMEEVAACKEAVSDDLHKSMMIVLSF